MEKRFTLGVQEALRFNPDGRLSKGRRRSAKILPWDVIISE